jgi:thymidylate synthase
MGRLPQLIVEGDSLPEVWEKSILKLWNEGIDSFKETYRVGKEKDVIREASMKMVVRDPSQEPMVHTGYEGIMNLNEYVNDVIEGSKDYLIGPKGYDYTYHQQIFKFKVENKIIDQSEQLIKKLTETPFSNRAQFTTWMPWRHYEMKGPPCLQRGWCKVIDGELEMHTDWRSRDAFHAAFANMYALTKLQKFYADRLGVKVGQYVDDSDSYHVYEEHFNSAKKFVKTVEENKISKENRWVDSSFLEKLKT